MENKYLEQIIDEMKGIIKDADLKVEDNILKNDTKSIKIERSEETKLYTIAIADVDGENIGEYKQISAWLFDDNQTAKDAVAVGIDFSDALRKELNIAEQKPVVNSLIDLPTAKKGSDSGINALTKKMLDIFPALKEEYKAHVAHYGNFLYLNFFGEHLVPRLVRLFEEGTSKQIKKFYNTILDFYVEGDNDTINTVVALLAAAAYNNDAVTQKIRDMLADNNHFLNSFNNFLPAFAKNKKLVAALIKKEM
ncbi:MAG: hypothetical protein J6C27_07575 [Clostridia bacterium]|nr:hypothetical protein [Clostridia bacterium]